MDASTFYLILLADSWVTKHQLREIMFSFGRLIIFRIWNWNRCTINWCMQVSRFLFCSGNACTIFSGPLYTCELIWTYQLHIVSRSFDCHLNVLKDWLFIFKWSNFHEFDRIDFFMNLIIFMFLHRLYEICNSTAFLSFRPFRETLPIIEVALVLLFSVEHEHEKKKNRKKKLSQITNKKIICVWISVCSAAEKGKKSHTRDVSFQFHISLLFYPFTSTLKNGK